MCRPAFLVAVFVLTFTLAPEVEAQIVGSELSGPEGQQLLRAFAISSAATAAPLLIGGTLWYSSDPTKQAIGLGLAAAGFVVGPSAGSLYLDDTRRALIGTAIRGAGAAAFATGFGLGLLKDSEDAGTLALSSGLISVSVIMLSYGFAFNFVNMPHSVREARVQVAAAYDRESGQLVPMLVVRF